MHYFQKFFQSSSTKLSSEIGDVATVSLPSPLEPTTAKCATPDQARRIVRTIDGQQLVLCADDVKYLSVIENMFVNVKALNNAFAEEPFVIIPISIESSTMQKIIDWSRAAKKHNEETLDFRQFFPEITVKECIQILEASLFLETTALGKCAGKWLAAKLEGKSTGEMANILEVPNVGLDPERKQKLSAYSRVVSGDAPSGYFD
ncbi:unnamed protein product [Caenorhabditis sp. 36 PRJEB53466]|nr:unnamed protein product [Caenorhabditis sp. 36 PRJEB53466]